MTLDEGVIKFDFSAYKPTDSVNNEHFLAIEPTREEMYKLGLIGFYEDHQVGYGNISMRLNLANIYSSSKPQFIISGTQTGHISKLTSKHYTYIIDYDLSKNAASSMGPILPSSESLTHASIYEANSNINAIIHIHNKEIWHGLIEDKKQFTDKNIPYGTVEMAKCVKDFIKKMPQKSFAMAGHEDGVIIYGENFKEATNKTIELYKLYVLNP